MWCNSLDVTDPAGNPYFFNNLYDDLADGIMMLKLLEKIGAPVEWKKVNIPATNKFKALENCNYAVDLGKKMNFTLVGIGGSDIYDKKKKLVLGCMWQMVRKHVLDVKKFCYNILTI
jgi:Ca2+-binding actin-bundling protein fimbrin/plastin (EF-Hand superfamily)